MCLGLLNGSSAVGRIIAGWVGDKVGYLNVFVVCQLGSAVVCLVVWPFAETLGMLVSFSILFGMMAGSYISVLPPMVVSLFGGGSAVAVLGMQMSSGFFASLAGPPIAGAITDSQTTVAADGSKQINW